MSTRKRPAPTRRTGGQVTSKKGPSPRGDAAGRAPEASTRYTPPNPRGNKGPSPRWVPALMLALIALGVLVIFLHYVNLLLPGGDSNWYLLIGLGLILGGIVTATQYR